MTDKNLSKKISKLNIVIVIVIIFAGIWFYNYSTLKTKCEKQVFYNSGIRAEIRNTQGSFSWNGIIFESRKEAVKACMRNGKEAE